MNEFSTKIHEMCSLHSIHQFTHNLSIFLSLNQQIVCLSVNLMEGGTILKCMDFSIDYLYPIVICH